MPVTPADYIAAIDAALAICEARLAACDAATAGPWHDDRDDESGHYYAAESGGTQVAVVLSSDATGKHGAENAAFIAAARTDQPASLRRDIAGLQAHWDAEAEPRPDNAYDAVIHDKMLDVHRDYSQRIFADCGVTVAAELAKGQE